MKPTRRLTAIATATALFFSTVAIPQAATARPVLGDPLSNYQDHNSMGIRTITVVDHDTLLPNKELKVKVLFVKDYNGKIYPKYSGVGFDKVLFDAINHGASSVKQYENAAQIKENFPDEQLRKLPSGVYTSISNGSWVLQGRNRQSKSIEFTYWSNSYYAQLSDNDYKSDWDGLGNGIIALEFTFPLKGKVPLKDNITLGGYFADPANSGASPNWDSNWHHQLAPVRVKGRREADVEMLTKSGTHAPGSTVTLKAKVTPSDYSGKVVFHVGSEIYTRDVVNRVATLEYTMGNAPVNISATTGGTDQYSAATTDQVVRLTPGSAPSGGSNPSTGGGNDDSGNTGGGTTGGGNTGGGNTGGGNTGGGNTGGGNTGGGTTGGGNTGGGNTGGGNTGGGNDGSGNTGGGNDGSGNTGGGTPINAEPTPIEARPGLQGIKLDGNTLSMKVLDRNHGNKPLANKKVTLTAGTPPMPIEGVTNAQGLAAFDISSLKLEPGAHPFSLNVENVPGNAMGQIQVAQSQPGSTDDGTNADNANDNANTDPGAQPGKETSSAKEYWWAILLGILAALGIGGGGIWAWATGLIR